VVVIMIPFVVAHEFDAECRSNVPVARVTTSRLP